MEATGDELHVRAKAAVDIQKHFEAADPRELVLKWSAFLATAERGTYFATYRGSFVGSATPVPLRSELLRVFSIAIYREHLIEGAVWSVSPASQIKHDRNPSRVPEGGPGMAFSHSVVSKSWVVAVATGLAYFLAGRLSFALRADPIIACFWPAAGIAVGALLALGASARLPIAAAVVMATTVSNLMIGRNAWLAIAFGSINAGQTLFTAWLLERWFEGRFKLEDVQRVLGFLGASALGSAIAAVGAAIAVNLINPTASPLHVWRIWFAASLLGIVTVAPLLIGLGDVLRERPTRRELIEGWAGLVAIAALNTVLISLPDGPWATALPETLVFPFLLLVAIRCRPVFAAAAAFVVGLTVIGSTTLNIGHFGSSMPLTERIVAAQTFALAAAIIVVLLAALFTERRRNEAALKDSNDRLKDSNDRLQLALDGAQLGVWSIDLITGRFENDARDRLIHNHHPKAPPKTLAEARTLIRPDDLPTLDAAFAASSRTGGSYKAEYRLAPVSSNTNADQECWVALEGTVVRGADGKPLRLLGVTRDITERKHTEQKLQKSERETRELLGALPAAIYVTDAAGRITYCNQSAIDLWGVQPKLGRDKWCDLSRFYFADGSSMALDECPTEIALKQGQIVREREAIIERRDGTRIPITPYPTPLYDATGTVVGVVNMTVDITERKKAERALAERNVQLALAGKAGLVGSFAYDTENEMMQISEGYAAIHGYPERTTEMARSECLATVHPDDIAQVKLRRSQAFHKRHCEYNVEYRIIRPSDEIRWVETRCFISYDAAGDPKRVAGVSIDITERKRAEEHQRTLVAELDHRVKNVLATVSAVAGHTLEASSSMNHFVAALDGRIRSMAIAHELLSTRQWHGVPMVELVQRELAAYTSSNNTIIDGPDVMLSAEAGQAIAMVIHELATNAAKHGALSSHTGRVSVRWYRKLNGSAQFILLWQETGGPKVRAPKKSGYGTGVVRDLVPYEFGGTVDLAFAPDGVRCRLEVPFERINMVSRNTSESERLRHAGRSSSALPS
jgi:PAS domain S-box-containing protein